MDDPKIFINKLKNKYSKQLIERNHEFIPTGIFPLDIALGGGLREASAIEIAGGESSGKTTLTIRTVANLMKVFPNQVFVYFDFENVFDWEWAITNGIECDVTELPDGKKEYTPKGNFVLLQPLNGNAMFEILDDMFKTEQLVKGIVIDSLPAIVFEGEELTKTSAIAIASRANSKLARFISGKLNQNGTFLFIINQIRDGLDMYGPNITKPGGHAIKHLYSYQIDLKRKKSDIDAKDFDSTVYMSELKMSKNKFYGDGLKNDIYISRTKGLSLELNITNLLIDLGIIERRGPYYYVKGNEQGIQGREKTIEYLSKNKSALIQTYKEYIESIKKPNIPFKYDSYELIFS